ncbi:mercuric transporter MerT family protein [Rhodoligotrophos defluvii]|uniref:mercuric transporter MerT family protein n=1 Tax=Rhodoligotrophos defluvii TaxID=2561934 RepID=UPI001484FFC6|nr:mercuric transporter MerT family protein [Rhodoligotrophos defluvii]
MRAWVNGTAGLGAAFISLVTGLGAVAASSCCVLPLALSVVGFGGAWLSGVSELVFYRPYFLIAAAVTLAMGWVVVLRRRPIVCTADDACARPQRSWLTFGTLGLSTLLVGVAAAWSWIGPAVMAALLRLAEGTA